MESKETVAGGQFLPNKSAPMGTRARSSAIIARGGPQENMRAVKVVYNSLASDIE